MPLNNFQGAVAPPFEKRGRVDLRPEEIDTRQDLYMQKVLSTGINKRFICLFMSTLHWASL